MLKMKALQRFSHVIAGQQYYGDPEHPNKDHGQHVYARNEAEAQELADLGYAKRVRSVELSDDDADLAILPAGGENQLLMDERQSDVARAAASAEGEILGADTSTEGKSKALDGGPIPQGGLLSTATDNHPLNHTSQTDGNARGTPDPDAPPMTSTPTPSAPRRRGSASKGSTGTGSRKSTGGRASGPKGGSPSQRQAASLAGTTDTKTTGGGTGGGDNGGNGGGSSGTGTAKDPDAAPSG